MTYNYGYTVEFSIDVIDEICSDPEHYRMLSFIKVMNDAEVHYKHGNATKNWYDSVCRILSEYI